MKQLTALIAISVGLLTSYAHSQQANPQSPTMVMDHNSAALNNVIDGAEHPELIPDLTAYRLWLLAVSADVQDKPDKSETARKAHLRAAHIADADISTADAILVQFRSDYSRLVANYNASRAAGQQPSLDFFVTQRDLLVQQTAGSLQSKLGSDSFSNLQGHMQAEKAHMKIAKEVK